MSVSSVRMTCGGWCEVDHPLSKWAKRRRIIRCCWNLLLPACIHLTQEIIQLVICSDLGIKPFWRSLRAVWIDPPRVLLNNPVASQAYLWALGSAREVSSAWRGLEGCFSGYKVCYKYDRMFWLLYYRNCYIPLTFRPTRSDNSKVMRVNVLTLQIWLLEWFVSQLSPIELMKYVLMSPDRLWSFLFQHPLACLPFILLQWNNNSFVLLQLDLFSVGKLGRLASQVRVR